MTEYIEDATLARIIKELLENPTYVNLEGLRRHGTKFVSCARVNEDKDGNTVPCKGPAILTKKISDLHRLWIPASYLIVVDNAVWTTANDQDQRYLVMHALCNISVTMAADGSLKLSPNKPDIMAHSAAVAYFPQAAEVSHFKRLMSSNADAMMAPHLAASAESSPPGKKAARKAKMD